MTAIDKLINKFKSKPNDFTFGEFKRLLKSFGYKEKQGAGSRVVFVNEKIDHKIKLDKPHPGKILKRYQLDIVEHELKIKGWL